MTRLAPFLVALAALVVPSTAIGATTSVVDGELRFVAGAGETNSPHLELIEDGATYRIRENRVFEGKVPYGAGPGCTLVNATDVHCPAAGVTRIAVALGDRDDDLRIGRVPVPVTVSSGTGTDSFGYALYPDTGPLTITADGVADDGPAGRDNIAPDVENIYGDSFADKLLNGPGGGFIVGRTGDDRLTGGAGDDVIHAAYVEDVGTESGSFYPEGSDTIKCGGGRDFVYASSTDVVDPDCEAVGRKLSGPGFEFMGSNGPDRISVPYGWEPSVVFGRGGDDLLISGFAGAQRIVGGAGNDRIQGGGIYHSPRQRLEGGSGNDRIRARDPGKGFRDIVLCGPGRDHAIVDRLDSVSGCERVSRSR